MNKVIQKTTGIVLGALLTIVSATPVLADDTELLVVTPPDPSETKPNVVFILDTSGSMTTVQKTGEPFDSTRTYTTGTCEADKLYYSDTGDLPVCTIGNEQFIDKTSYVCAAAKIQMEGVGSYTNVHVQYRVGESGLEEWTELEPGNDDDVVECQADSGVHGNGTPGEMYAVSGTGLANPWTSDPAAELDWASSGRNITYTMYDGNYLNYREDPASVDLSRSQIMKNVTKKVLNSVNDMNVGLMRFNDRDGGPILLAPVDLDSNRAAIMGMIDGLGADGWTPLSETLFESALFWQGLPAHYGQLFNEHATDPAALASSGPEVYKTPEMLSCSKNFNVLITDGAPTQDTDTSGLLGQLPDYATTVGRVDCTGNGQGACLDDIAEYLSKKDINGSLIGRQSVTTHTIGFTVDLPILSETARVSGGQYILANDVDSLTLALTEIVSQINERALSFTAPAVSVNTFNRTRNLNDVYLTMFGARGNAHWPGNLKAYRINDGKIVDALGADAVDPGTGFFYTTARSFWTTGQADGNDVLMGGAANNLPAPGTRQLFTDNGFDDDLSGPSNAIHTDNKDMFSDADFGLPAGPVTKEEIIEWMRGADIMDVDGDPATLVRNAMGDPLHSRPAAVVYGGTEASPEAVIYTATNDGYLHAVDAQTGVELWSYVPKELLPGMARLMADPEMNYKLYGIDGDIIPVVRDKDRDGTIEAADGDFVVILFGMRRGGYTFRALDVTNKAKPKLMWSKVLDEGGQSWSAPVITRMDIPGVGQNPLKAVAVFGGGYDQVHDTPTFNTTPDGTGSGVHIVDLVSGDTLWRAGHSSTDADLKFDTMTRAIPSRIRVIDMNGDSLADRMYAADLGGQIWRFDISNGNDPADLIAGGVIARFGPEGMVSPSAGDTRRFYNSPDVSMFNDIKQNRRFLSVSIGSGYRAHPLNLDSTDRFYSLRDANVFNSLTQDEYDAITPITESELVDISGKVGVTVTSADAGWMLTLPDNEMVLADSVTFNNELFFVSFSPDSAGAQACDVGQGTNFLYRVNILNGDPIVDDLGNIDAGDEDQARKQQLAQGGIAPSPQFLFPSPDDPDCQGEACNPPPIGCVGVECFDPGFKNNPVRTLWTQDGIE